MYRKIVFIVSFLFVLYVGVVIGFNIRPVASIPSSAIVTPKQEKPDIYKLWILTNRARATAALKPLRLSPQLNASAEMKCEELITRNYWDHKDPSGRMSWHYFEEAGYLYGWAGENLAYGYASTEKLFQGWMDSTIHRKDILSSHYLDVGFGVCHSSNFVGDGSQYVVVQHFGSPR